MSTPKILVALFTVGLAIAVYHAIVCEERAAPANERVDETHFGRLQRGMLEAQVENILGLPHKTSGGDIVRTEHADSSDLACMIEEQPRVEGGNRLNVYQGREEESIKVLFSGKDGTMTAAEYSVSNYPVIYHGPLTAGESKSLMAVSSGQTVGSDEQQKRRQNLARYRRKKELQDFAAESVANPSASPSAPSPPVAQQFRPAECRPAEEPCPKPSPSAVQPPVAPPAASAAPSPPPASPPSPPASQAPMSAGDSVPASSASGDQAAPVRITFPSGQMLTEMMLEPPAGWQDKLFPKDAAVFVAKYSNDTVQGVFTLNKAKLHGPAATLHDNGHLETLAFYADGKLHGVLRIWNDKKERVLYAEYKNGGKNGLLCLFHDRLPWLAQEWSKASLQQEYLIKFTDQTPAILSASDMKSEHAEELASAQEQLGSVEHKLLTNERRLKREMADWYRKQDRKLKQQKASLLTPALRDAALQRIDDRNAAKGVEWDVFWRASLQRSGM